MDPENEHDNEECHELVDEEHPDYDAIHPDNFVPGAEKTSTSTVSCYQQLRIWERNELFLKTQQLNREQRFVLDIFVLYARDLRKALAGLIPFPTPSLMVVEGDAGTGKSTLIKVLCQWFERELRCAGDNPEHPYLLKGCFTGDASALIEGITLHSLFRLGFKKRSQFASR